MAQSLGSHYLPSWRPHLEAPSLSLGCRFQPVILSMALFGDVSPKELWASYISLADKLVAFARRDKDGCAWQ